MAINQAFNKNEILCHCICVSFWYGNIYHGNVNQNLVKSEMTEHWICKPISLWNQNDAWGHRICVPFRYEGISTIMGTLIRISWKMKWSRIGFVSSYFKTSKRLMGAQIMGTLIRYHPSDRLWELIFSSSSLDFVLVSHLLSQNLLAALNFHIWYSWSLLYKMHYFGLEDKILCFFCIA